MYLVRNGELLETKADRQAIGRSLDNRGKEFTTKEVEIQKDDVIYLFSDGYADQFGGPEGKKFKYRRFRHLLMSIHQHSMEDQLRKLEEDMDNWMGKQEDQIDDQTILGIRPASFSSF